MPALVLMAIAWAGGLVMAHHWLVPHGVHPAALLAVAVLPSCVLVLRLRDPVLRLSSTCALVLLAGALRYQAALPRLDDPRFVAFYNDSGRVDFQGVVRSYPDRRDTCTYLHLAAEWIEVDGQRHWVEGRVLVRAERYPEYGYGDRLRLQGWLRTPPEIDRFSYRDYLARQGIYSFSNRPDIELVASNQGNWFLQAVSALRDRARRAIGRLVPEPGASLLQGMVLGVESEIPRELYEQFNATSTSHIIVISGANIVIIAAVLTGSFGRLLGRKRATWFVVLGIASYVLFVGAEAPVVRAGIMGCMYALARQIGRRSSAFVSLFAAAMTLTLVRPLALWDAGFQLSFAATLALLAFGPPLERLARGIGRRVPLPGAVSSVLDYGTDLLAPTLAAQVFTTPAAIYHFGRLSPVAPLANLLIAPVQPMIMTWGGAGLVAGLIPALEPVAQIVLWVPWLCLHYTTAVVGSLANWRWASLQLDRSVASWVAFGWIALLAVAWSLGSRRRWHAHVVTFFGQHWPGNALCSVLLIALVLVSMALGKMPDGRLHVSFLDVGQGDAILIVTAEGRKILVDGGPSPAALTSALGKELPFWDRSIDLVVSTHPDQDHLAGLVEVLSRYRVGGWIESAVADDSPLSKRRDALLQDQGVVRHCSASGERLQLGHGTYIDVLHPPQGLAATALEPNDRSLVLRLVQGDLDFLLTADITGEAEQMLMRSGLSLQAEVLKVAHHGSAASTSAAFLAAVDPYVAIISVGQGNRSGLPAPPTLDRLARQGGVTILRTDLHGTICLTTDGTRLWVKTER